MIRIQQLKLPVGHTPEQLERKIRRELHLKQGEEWSYTVRKRSLDARKKPELYFCYVVDCIVSHEREIYRCADQRNVILTTEKSYRFPEHGKLPMEYRPVIVGTGPAGLFCGLMLARHGYRPVLLERGQDVDTRIKDVADFWETGTLKPESNVQFGEGGAGTFSDGKLNTLVKDKDGRNREVLRLFVEAGADSSILYDSKPHIGTDELVRIVRNIREKIERCGGSVRFGAQMTGILTGADGLTGLVINKEEVLPCKTAVLALGHSARNTFQMLYDAGVQIEAKEFAVGFRVEHRQTDINLSQYGSREHSLLSAASYKMAAQAANGRKVYSFCMCPGGYVVNASSEENCTAVNGMSYSGRDGANANSAIIVSVGKEDFPSAHPLAGVAFQRKLEEAAYRAGGGKIPVQKLGDFRDVFAGRTGVVFDRRTDGAQPSDAVVPAGWRQEEPLTPAMKGGYVFTDLTQILPAELTEAFLDGMEQFSRVIKGFADRDVLVSAVESRTSSPLRMVRDGTMQSNIKGIYPCGEGAGYAGGITSAAMDGLRVAEALAGKYRSFEENGK